MNGLEKIVPPLELCKQIPAGEFADSKLVLLNTSRKEVTLCVRGDYESWLGRYAINAPALEEIAEKTPGGIIVNFDEHYVESCKYDCNGESMHEIWTEKENAATAALRLWQRIRKAEALYA